MTTYTIHENAGETSKIKLDGDSGVQEKNFLHLSFITDKNKTVSLSSQNYSYPKFTLNIK